MGTTFWTAELTARPKLLRRTLSPSAAAAFASWPRGKTPKVPRGRQDHSNLTWPSGGRHFNVVVRRERDQASTPTGARDFNFLIIFCWVTRSQTTDWEGEGERQTRVDRKSHAYTQHITYNEWMTSTIVGFRTTQARV